MLLLLGGTLSKEGDRKQAMELLGRARETIPLQKYPHLIVISLVSYYSFRFPDKHTDLAPKIFGWDFDGLDLAIQQRLQECLKSFEGHGDATMFRDADGAILQYTAALSLNPPNPGGILVKRSKALAVLGKWEDALKDADEVDLCLLSHLTILNITGPGNPDRTTESVGIRKKTCGPTWFAALRRSNARIFPYAFAHSGLSRSRYSS